MSLAALIRGKRGKSGFGFASTAEEVTEGLDLTGKTALITGVSSGLGQETARVLRLRGAHVIGTARDTARAEVACDLSEPSSVRAAVETVKRLGRPIDMLICNAGVMAFPKLEQKHSYELQFLTNHIGHFTLVTGLLGQLSETARVVMLSSYGHIIVPKGGIDFENLSGERGYSKWRAYGQSKLANLLFAKSLAARFAGSAKTANAVHPGVIRTPLARHLSGALNASYAALAPLFAKSVEQGAATTCYVATHPDLAEKSGLYYADCNEKSPSRHADDPELAETLWQRSEEILKSLS